MDEKLLQFIRERQASGYEKDQVRRALMSLDLDEKLVEKHMHAAWDKKKMKVPMMVISLCCVVIAIGIIVYLFATQMFDKTEEPPVVEMSLEEAQAILNEAVIAREQSLCGTITLAEVRDTCYGRFQPVIDETPCDAACEDQNTLNMAIIRRDPALCAEIVDLEKRQECKEDMKRRGIE